jgi:hypothetical protein
MAGPPWNCEPSNDNFDVGCYSLTTTTQTTDAQNNTFPFQPTNEQPNNLRIMEPIVSDQSQIMCNSV